MRTRFWGILGLLFLLMLVPLAGCATGPGYQGSEAGYYRAPESEYPAVPPSYYDYNPQYEHWFTAPEWMPEIGP
jgi:hypothetical protein